MLYIEDLGKDPNLQTWNSRKAGHYMYMCSGQAKITTGQAQITTGQAKITTGQAQIKLTCPLGQVTFVHISTLGS